MNNPQKEVVASLIGTAGGIFRLNAGCSLDLQQALLQLYTWGMVVPDSEDGDSWEGPSFRITSPMHAVVMAQQLYHDTMDVQNIKLLVRIAIQRLNPAVLRLSAGRSVSNRRPLEGVYHQELYRVICGLLPRDDRGVKAVLSTFVGQVSRRLDSSFCSEVYFRGLRLP